MGPRSKLLWKHRNKMNDIMMWPWLTDTNTLWFSLAMKCFDSTWTKHHLEREHYVYTCCVHKQCVWIYMLNIQCGKYQRMTAGQQVVISFVLQWDPMVVMYDPCSRRWDLISHNWRRWVCKAWVIWWVRLYDDGNIWLYIACTVRIRTSGYQKYESSPIHTIN